MFSCECILFLKALHVFMFDFLEKKIDFSSNFYLKHHVHRYSLYELDISGLFYNFSSGFMINHHKIRVIVRKFSNYYMSFI